MDVCLRPTALANAGADIGPWAVRRSIMSWRIGLATAASWSGREIQLIFLRVMTEL